MSTKRQKRITKQIRLAQQYHRGIRILALEQNKPASKMFDCAAEYYLLSIDRKGFNAIERELRELRKPP